MNETSVDTTAARCVNFTGVSAGTKYPSTFSENGFEFRSSSEVQYVKRSHLGNGLEYLPRSGFTIVIDPPSKKVTLSTSARSDLLLFSAFDQSGNLVASQSVEKGPDVRQVELVGKEIARVTVEAKEGDADEEFLFTICAD